MATTTNYGWTTPDDTDLVKDGASAIRTLGSSIDTTLKAQIDAQIPDSIVDAKGDLISATADNTPARLASSGVNGQILTVDTTTATGLKWAAPASTGVTWTYRVIQSGGQPINSIAYNGSNLYVAAGNNGTLHTSPDGITWTSRTSGFGANVIKKVYYASGLSLWIAVGQNGTITTSSDGTTWTARTANVGTNQLNDVFASGTTVVAVGEGGGTTNTGGITYSSDGTTWTRKSQSVNTNSTYYAVTYNGTNWIVGAQASTSNYLYASTPSGTWTAADIGGDGAGNDIFVILWDGTRHIINAQGTLCYSVNTTASSPTRYRGVGQPITNAQQNLMLLYSGTVYCAGQFTYDWNPTPVGTNYPTSISQFSTTPSATSSLQTATAYFVGAVGKILATNSGIYTSF